MNKKKSLKTHLSEIFLKQDFAELCREDKKKQLKECFLDDLKWASVVLLLVLAYIIYVIY
jgi:hypothetical protein